MKLLINATVYPMAGRQMRAEAMAWEKGRIVAVGRQADLTGRFPRAQTVDTRGGIVVPGFIDPHIHFLPGILYRRALDCSAANAPTVDALKAILSRAARSRPADHWVIGQGYDPWEYPDRKPPTRHDLDAACPNHPTAIFHYSFHECVANSKALALAGIDRHTSDPFAGQIRKDRNGRPDGGLIETAMAEVHRLSQQFLLNHCREAILAELPAAQQDLFACGITRIGDPAVDSGAYGLYAQAYSRDILQLPVVVHFCSDRHMFKLPWDVLSAPFPPSPNPRLIHGPLKIFLDGADRAAVEMSLGKFLLTCAATLIRCCRERSPDPLMLAGRSPSRLGKDLKVRFGTMMAETEEGIQLARKATQMGFPLAFHAIGNQAVNQAVEIVRQVRNTHPTAAPPRIEHALFLEDETIRAIQELGIAVVTQPAFLPHMDPTNVPYLPGFRQMPINTFLASGIRVAGSSDWPVASHDPLLAMHHAVTRTTRGQHVLQPEESVTVEAAMAMYTTEAAYVLGCGHEVGSLEAGKRADFLVLTNDPYRHAQDLTNHVEVRQTWLDGKRVFSREVAA